MNPIAWHDVSGYFALHRLRPATWELDLIRRLDGVALTAMAPKTEADQPKPTGPKLRPGGKPHLRGKRKAK